MYFDILMLRVLADGERHGYEIKKRVERILGGRSINNNVLYPALRRFEEQGAIRRVAAQADPGRPAPGRRWSWSAGSGHRSAP